jgi:uncharacterized membrane protein (UPF0127 family)
VAVAAVAALLLAGCSGSSGDATTSTVTVISVQPGSTTVATTAVATTAVTTAVATTIAGASTTLAGTERVPEGFSSVVIEVTKPDGSVEEFCVLLAANSQDRARGLMEVDSLGGYDGMLFVFESEFLGAFYMLKTRIPLSIAFLAADGSLVSSTDMAPCPDDDDDPPCPRYSADGPFQMAIEVPQGGLDELGIGPGSLVRSLDRPC